MTQANKPGGTVRQVATPDGGPADASGQNREIAIGSLKRALADIEHHTTKKGDDAGTVEKTKRLRKAEIARKTSETDVTVVVDLDGSGKHDIKTGIGFLDHMLDQLAKHALIDMTIRAKGDLHIDFHHTAEDVGIALGQAIKKALGDKQGIARYASADLPMDGTLSRVALDISGRPFLVWKVAFTADKVGEMDTELFREWFQAFAMHAGVTLHAECFYGDNNHHIAESLFKALARALKAAVARDPRLGDAIPSTKGVL